MILEKMQGGAREKDWGKFREDWREDLESRQGIAY